MSNRRQAFSSGTANPAKKFLEWRSHDKCFQFYDKEQGKNIEVKLPFTFLTLKEMHTVKGWDDKSGSRIYSNEVESIVKDNINVRSFKGGTIAEGIYKEIKGKIVSSDVHYYKSIYIMTDAGEIWNISLKGSAVQAWGDFTQKTRNRLPDEWVNVPYAATAKKGSVNYSVPVFEFKGSLEAEAAAMADECFDELESYLKNYSHKESEPEIDELIHDDEPPF